MPSFTWYILCVRGHISKHASGYIIKENLLNLYFFVTTLRSWGHVFSIQTKLQIENISCVAFQNSKLSSMILHWRVPSFAFRSLCFVFSLSADRLFFFQFTFNSLRTVILSLFTLEADKQNNY